MIQGVAILSVQLTLVIALPEFYQDNSFKELAPNDDGASIAIALSPSLPFYGHPYKKCYVQNNGIVYMDGMPTSYINEPLPLPNVTFVAPFYGDVDTRGAGTTRYTMPVSTNRELLEKARKSITDAWPEYGEFTPAYLVVATWQDVGYFNYGTDKLNTFQCVLATDGNMSFAIFLYNKIEWVIHDKHLKTPDQIPTPAKVGFNEGFNEIISSWEVPCSGSSNISLLPNTSNVGRPGVWIFRIDGEEIVSACPNQQDQQAMFDNDSCAGARVTRKLSMNFICANECCEEGTTCNGNSSLTDAIIALSILAAVLMCLIFIIIILLYYYYKKYQESKKQSGKEK